MAPCDRARDADHGAITVLLRRMPLETLRARLLTVRRPGPLGKPCRAARRPGGISDEPER
jgi:hypothetical protein